jgi:hypothetical protein
MGWRERFPGFDAAGEWRHWDPATVATVQGRLGQPPPIRYFSPEEHASAHALCAGLLGLEPDCPVPVVAMIDSRLAEQETDGWHYEDMPEDGMAWRLSLAGLKADAVDRYQLPFAALDDVRRDRLIGDVRESEGKPWHEMPAGHLWSLWTRYACTAFYSHPYAWNEMGFPGPAYPRGYKNLGVDARDPREVPDRGES